jgi:hypothetical protein
MNEKIRITHLLYAPRAKFESIYVLSPIKVASVFLLCLHCLFLLIAIFASFWIETSTGYYGPVFRCEQFNRQQVIRTTTNDIECHRGGFVHDYYLFSMSHSLVLIVLSFVLTMISIVVASLSFNQQSDSIRYRYWLCHIVLVVFICLFDCFILISIPFSYRNEAFRFQWAYGVFCGATLFTVSSLIMAIATHDNDDIHYIEGMEYSPMIN